MEYDFRCFFLDAPRLWLNRQLDYRCELMLHEGLLEEVASLRAKGLATDTSACLRACCIALLVARASSSSFISFRLITRCEWQSAGARLGSFRHFSSWSGTTQSWPPTPPRPRITVKPRVIRARGQCPPLCPPGPPSSTSSTDSRAHPGTGFACCVTVPSVSDDASGKLLAGSSTRSVRTPSGDGYVLIPAFNCWRSVSAYCCCRNMTGVDFCSRGAQRFEEAATPAVVFPGPGEFCSSRSWARLLV